MDNFKKFDKILRLGMFSEQVCEAIYRTICGYLTKKDLENYKDKPEYLTEEDKAYFNEKLEVLKKMEEDKDFSNLDSLDKDISARWDAIAFKAYGGNNNGFDINDILKGGFNPNAGGAPNSTKPNDSKDDFEEV